MVVHSVVHSVVAVYVIDMCVILCSFFLSGKWLRVKSFEELKERAIFETSKGGYIIAEDTGYFSVGDDREEGKGYPNERVSCVIKWSNAGLMTRCEMMSCGHVHSIVIKCTSKELLTLKAWHM